MENKEIIIRFYEAFQKADAKTMVSFYDDNIQFSDPAFGELKGERAKNMWLMLVRPGIQLSFKDVWTNGNKGGANWQAEYVFSPTGKKVINKIKAEFEFKDGKILIHNDNFDLWKWSRQALGIKGLLLGWSNFFKKALQAKVGKQLDKFEIKKA